ncbi:glycosyltransferase [Mastigocladopsis repens]|uniref:glycosyltransferase n=1 Tax=Mastigocladopsis repens TaxID=221287 RepID=UPI000474C39A|nr:glycosyltransferase [Mastigocladopsis repens]
MTHFGLICPASTGHLNTMLPLGKELQKRGHRVTLIGVVDAQPKTLAAGLEFQAIGESEFPTGAIAQSLTNLGKLSGIAATAYTMSLLKQMAAVILRDAPKVIKQAGVEALLIDQVSPEGAIVAEFLGIPFVTICSAVVLNQEESVPPHFTNWRYHPAWWARLRNKVSYELVNGIGKSIMEVMAKYRRECNLPPLSLTNNGYSQLAQISQQPAELEFPRQHLPKYFHFTGPFHSLDGREPVAFPYEKLTGQPLIYASMGTIQNRLQSVFRDIAQACEGLDVQLVISLGGALEPEALPKLPGEPLIVKYAPQLDLLKKTTLTITHAGLNTTLESLSNGVPMVAIPVANDQPGVAARIAWTGAGEFIPLSRLSVPKLGAAIQRVLTQDSYKQNALRLQAAIRRAGGVTRAADIVEKAISTGKPVLA